MIDPVLLDQAIREVAYKRMMHEIREWVIMTGSKDIHAILDLYQQKMKEKEDQHE